jgi:prepilin-type processing-associated H-X9-DG protein
MVRDGRGTFLAIRENWGSSHPGGVNFLFADGSVRAISFGTATDKLAAMLTPDGGEATTE